MYSYMIIRAQNATKKSWNCAYGCRLEIRQTNFPAFRPVSHSNMSIIHSPHLRNIPNAPLSNPSVYTVIKLEIIPMVRSLFALYCF